MNRLSSEPDVWASVVKSFDAGQRLIADRIDLIRLDTLTAIERGVKTVVFLLAGAVLLGLGWFITLGAAVVLLRPWVDPGISLGVVGLLHLVGGIVLLRMAKSPAKKKPAEGGAPSGK